jgi:uncharacterized transporter YbjL
MARKRNTQRRSWQMVVFLAISLVIVLSMVLGSIIMALPGN